jgi:hypothetical protein
VSYQSTNIVKQLQKSYDVKFQEVVQLKEQDLKGNSHLFMANFLTHLMNAKEDNIMKKVLLDWCFKELRGISVFLLDKNDPLIKKMT